MGNKLGRDEHIKSIGALQKYYFKMNKEHGPFKVNVEVVDDDTNEVEKMKVNITIAYDTITQRINIMWEDVGYTREEFREKGLFGYYDCTWVPMDFYDDKLVISSSDSDKTIYVY